MKKVVMLDGSSFKGESYNLEKKIFKEHGISFSVCNCKNEMQIIEKAKDADAIITVFCNLSRGVLENLPKCKVVVFSSIGFNSIDLEAATEMGIVVCNIPDYCNTEVATHTVSLILSITRKLPLYEKSTKRGEWDNDYGYPIHRLSSLTLGLIGFGSIAQLVAKFMRPLDINIIAYDPFAPNDVFKENDVKKVTLEELYNLSDIISLHVPLVDDTHNMINKDSISKMKDGVMIVNTARGAVICLEDFLEAVDNNKIVAAAYNSVEAYEELNKKVAFTTINVLNGTLPENTVNIKKLKKLKNELEFSLRLEAI